MKNIGIMTCDKLKNKCAGVNCFTSFQRKIDAFSIYHSEDVALGAFFSCNGCDAELHDSMDYMFNQLRRKDINTIHMAYCIEVECHRYEGIHKVLSDEGFQVVKGSHTSVYKNK